MARSKLNPEQLSKLDINNKALAKAIDLSGSTKYAIGTGLVGSEYFLVQAAGGGAEARAVSASAMQDYFNKLDVTASSANATMKLLFVENSAGASSLDDVTAAMDNNSLTFNPSTNVLSGGAYHGLALDIESSIHGSGTLTAEGNTALGGTLQVTGAATLKSGANMNSAGISNAGAIAGASTIDGTGDLTMGTITMTNFSVGASGLVTAGASGTGLSVTNNASVGGNLTVTGDLTINGTTTTVNTQNTLIEDAIIQLGSASAGNSVTDGDRGIAFSLSSSADKLFFWDQSNSQFALGEALNGTVQPASGSNILVGDYAALRIGALTADDASTFSSTLAVSSMLSANGGMKATGVISGSSTLEAVGATRLGSTLGVTGAITAESSITAAGAISGSSTLEAVGATRLGSTLGVTGAITAAATVTAAGLITANGGVKGTSFSGSSTLEAVGAARLGSTLGVTGAITAESSISGSGNLSIGGTVRIDGAVDATADIDADKLYFMDADGSSLIKKQTISSVLALAKGDGIQVAGNGLISVDYQLEHFSGSTGSAGLFHSGGASAGLAGGSQAFVRAGTNAGAFTGSHSGLFAPIANDIVVGSLQVYLNGMLQVKSGSIHGTHDYELLNSGSSANRMIKFADEPEADDAIVIQYIKK